MNQTPITNMEGRYITPSTKEAYDAIVAMGHKPVYDFDDRQEALRVWNSEDGRGLKLYQGSIEYSIEVGLKQAYYQKGHFYDQPYEEFTITEEKVPFPELEDIRIDVTGGLEVFLPSFLESIKLNYIENIDIKEEYDIAKLAYENGLDVEWNLKEKIDRRLHKNRPLALAIGRAILEGIFDNYPVSTKSWAKSTNGHTLRSIWWDNMRCEFIFDLDNGNSGNAFEINDSYIFPDQVIEWMHEYEKEEQ